MHDDGLAYVREDKQYFGKTIELDDKGEPVLQGGPGLAQVPSSLEDATIEAAEACPGECIFLTIE